MDISNLVFSGFNRRVAALNLRSGKIVWNWRAPKGSTYVSLLLDSGVLIVSVDGYMYGLNPLTGSELWYNPMEGFGTGVTSLVSLNGIGSSPVIGAAARNQAQSDSSSPGASGVSGQ
jgi:outer membrane protein assembly factor BamB